MPLPTPSASAFSRRQFLQLTLPAVAVAGAVGPSLAAAAKPAGPSKATRPVPIGIELYAVRNALKEDLPGTLEQVAKIGYEAVEFYAPYFQWSFPYAKEVRTRLDDLGLRCLSTHNGFASFGSADGLAKATELNQILGTRQIVLASAPGGTETADDWKRLADQLAGATEQLQPHGLTAGFHNHQVEWRRLADGSRPMDLLAERTPQEFVLQLDVGTCMEAGGDPVAWIKSHPGRIRSIHLKDWAPGTEAEEKHYRVLFGEGVSPWREIVAAAEAVGGVEVYLMEQEGSRYSELETAARCLANWREFRAQA